MSDELQVQAPPTLMVDPTGALVEASPSDVMALTATGYRPATAEEQAQAASQAAAEERFGGLTGALEAGAAGAARGATLGLSDVALTKSGLVSPETLQGLKEASPTASMAGELAGNIAPLVLSGGTSAAGQGAAAAIRASARGLAPGLVSAAGRAVEGALGGGIAAKAAAGALEGAAYGAGNLVSEAALGDPGLTAESALHELALSGLLGGGLGAAFGAVERAIPKSVTAAKTALDVLDQRVDVGMQKEYPELAKALSGSSPETIREIWQNRASIWTDSNVRAKAAEELRANLQAVKDSGDDVRAVLARELKPAEFDPLLAAANPPIVAQQADTLLKSMARASKEIADHPGDYYSGTKTQIDRLRATAQKEIEEALGKGDMAAIFRRLEETKRLIYDETVVSGTASRAEQQTARLSHDVFEDFRHALQDQSVWGQAGARQEAINHALTQYSTATKQLEETIAGRTLTVESGHKEKFLKVESINRWLNQAADARGEWQGHVLDNWLSAYKTLVNEADASFRAAPISQNWNKASLDALTKRTEESLAGAKLSARTTQLMQVMDPASLASSWGSNPIRSGLSGHGSTGTIGALGLSSLVPHGLPLVGAAATLHAAYDFAKNPSSVIRTMMQLHEGIERTKRGLDTAARALVRGTAATGAAARGPVAAAIVRADEQERGHKRRVDLLKKAQQDPIGGISSAVGGLHEAVPETASALTIAAGRKIAFLQQAMPQPAQRGPLGQERQVSRAEMERFGRLYDAVDKPVAALRHAQDLSQAELDAIRATNPAIFEAYRKALLSALAEAGPEKLSSRQRRQMSRVLGQDVDGALALGRVAQAMPRQSQSQTQNQDAARPRAKLDSKAPDRALTAAQASAQRRP